MQNSNYRFIFSSFIEDNLFYNYAKYFILPSIKTKYCEVMKFKQFRMLTSGMNQTLGDVRWDEFCKLPTNNSFSVGVD